MDAGAADIRVFATPAEAADAAAERIVVLASRTIAQRGRFSIALSGGSTPKAVFALLADRYSAEVDWARVHIWWGDERFVPATNADSNTRMADEALLRHVRIPRGNVHRLAAEMASSEAAAADYERQLRAFDPAHPLDLVMLGIGPDGHTASLFPGRASLEEQQRWVVATDAPTGFPVRERITMTLPLINAVPWVMFLATGKEKAEMVSRLHGAHAKPLLPFERVRGARRVEWFIDRAAAG